MRIGSIVCFIIAILLGIGGLIVASKPSASPIATVMGAFALPALFAWWGVILHKRARSK
jgi:hypothetical protein